MKVAIVCQEEPVFLGPFIQRVIAARPECVSAVVLAGRRSAGESRGPRTMTWGSLKTFWLLFEPRAFFDALWRRLRFALLRSRDPNSVERVARKMRIPVHHLAGTRADHLIPVVEQLDVDLVLNQSEILLTDDVLRIPPMGFLNRHASLLPAHRGRLGSFWAHGATPPSYGVTIHEVDEGIDTGGILVQWESEDADPRWSFPRVLRHLNARAPDLFWEAVDGLAEGRPPVPQPAADSPPRRFPTLAEAREYRRVLADRRAGR